MIFGSFVFPAVEKWWLREKICVYAWVAVVGFNKNKRDVDTILRGTYLHSLKYTDSLLRVLKRSEHCTMQTSIVVDAKLAVWDIFNNS